MSTLKKKKQEITRITANVKPGKSCKSLFKKLHARAQFQYVEQKGTFPDYLFHAL